MMNDVQSALAASKTRPGDREPELPVLRFNLRHMFWGVTLVAVVVAAAAAGASSGFASSALLLAVLVVALHVAGTAIGTRLREHADQRQAWETATSGLQAAPTLPVTIPSPLHGRGTAMPRLRAWITVGVVVGAALGATILTITIGHRTSAVGIAVGALSTAILGGWFAFVAASFWAIFRQGWREAVEEHRQDSSRRNVAR